MKRTLFALLFSFGLAISPSTARAQDISALAAQGPGAHLISDDTAAQMISAYGSSMLRPANVRGAYIWDAAGFRKLLATPGAAQVRFHLALNPNGDFTINPEILDANGTSLAWGTVDTATGLTISPLVAQGSAQAWASTRMKPVNAPNTITYPASAFAWLLSLPGAAQLRMCPAINSTGTMTLVGAALDPTGAPVASPTSGPTMIDAGTPCPPAC